MRAVVSLLLFLGCFALCLQPGYAFRFVSRHASVKSARSLSMSAAPEPAAVKVGEKMVNADTFRDFELLDLYGTKRSINEVMGPGKSVVIFLRHLG